jgi:hypothetical protein
MPQVKLIVVSDDGQTSGILDLLKDELRGNMPLDQLVEIIRKPILKLVKLDVEPRVSNAGRAGGG